MDGGGMIGGCLGMLRRGWHDGDGFLVYPVSARLLGAGGDRTYRSACEAAERAGAIMYVDSRAASVLLIPVLESLFDESVPENHSAPHGREGGYSFEYYFDNYYSPASVLEACLLYERAAGHVERMGEDALVATVLASGEPSPACDGWADPIPRDAAARILREVSRFLRALARGAADGDLVCFSGP